ncbi:hypothetical protein MMC32_004793 [Xylographa parallela]|nr:hypothetical protein [Xylographa parallela]
MGEKLPASAAENKFLIKQIKNKNIKLCWKCLALFSAECPRELVTKKIEEAATARTRRHPDEKGLLRELETSQLIEVAAAEGCPLCLLLLDLLSGAEREAMREHWECSKEQTKHSKFVIKHSLYLEGELPPLLAVNYELPSLIVNKREREVKALVQLYPASDLESLANHRRIDKSTCSESSWAIATEWIDDCVANHRTCNYSIATTPALPTRVIDVGLIGYIAPRLHTLTQGTSNARYVTLSHCWGSYMPLRLLKSNITSMKQGILLSQVPQTFQDAMVIARRLGVRYIWIDSLCIIQDSEEDWREQSALMDQVYFNSFCNIAAAHASDSRGGCFIDRNPELIAPVKVHLNWGPQPGAYYCVKCYFWTVNVSEAPLNRRAWVYQERLLAPRTLYFGETQLYWECREKMACEAFPLQIPFQIGGTNAKVNFPLIDGGGRASRMQTQIASNAYKLWGRIVYAYTSGALSRESDKLIAISGIAARMREVVDDEYLAGMWRRHLAYQLLWQVRRLEKHVPRTRPLEYRAPTWSWASMIGKVEHACDIHYADHRDLTVDILDVTVELSTENPFGEIKGGHLRARGSIAKEGMLLKEDKSNRGSYSLLINGSFGGLALLDVDSEEVEAAIYKEIYYLPICYWLPDMETTGRIDTALPRISGILLRASGGAAHDEFVRVGQFDIFSQEEAFKQACCQFGGEIEEMQIEHERDNQWGNRYTVTIV